MSSIHKAVLCAGVLCSAMAYSADALYTVESPTLAGTTLFDQTLSNEGVITVKPSIPPSATGDVRVLSQCLWSVKVILVDGKSQFSPGKMVCVGPKKEVLESVPVGVIEPFGVCEDECQKLKVLGDSRIELTLSAPLSFSLQPRNERK